MLIYFAYDLDWNKSGVLGDTIGGLASPLVNLLAAYLVYISFEEQRISNLNQGKQIQISREESLISHYLGVYLQIKSDIYSDNSSKKIKSILIELEILITNLKLNIKENTASKNFLLNLLQAQILEFEQFEHMVDERIQLDYLKKLTQNE